MIYTIIAVAIARALQSFDLPDFKPFNCQSCLSFWTAVAIYLFVDYLKCTIMCKYPLSINREK